MRVYRKPVPGCSLKPLPGSSDARLGSRCRTLHRETGFRFKPRGWENTMYRNFMTKKTSLTLACATGLAFSGGATASASETAEDEPESVVLTGIIRDFNEKSEENNPLKIAAIGIHGQRMRTKASSQCFDIKCDAASVACIP